jgi:CBS domain-containing protein
MLNITEPISVMPLPRYVETVGPNSTIESCIAILSRKNIGSIIITENKKAIGIFTERDFITKIGTKYLELKDSPVSVFMTKEPMVVKKTDPIQKAIKNMRIYKFRHLIIVNEKMEVESIMSVKDVLDFLCKDLA